MSEWSHLLTADVRSNGVDTLKIPERTLLKDWNISSEMPLGTMNWRFSDSAPLQVVHSIMKPLTHFSISSTLFIHQETVISSFISWNKRSGMVMVVMLCLTAVCNACLKPTMTGFLVLMLVDFTLSSATRWNTTWTSARFEWWVMKISPVLRVVGRRAISAAACCWWLLAVDFVRSLRSKVCWMRHNCLSRSGKWNSVPDCWQIFAKFDKIPEEVFNRSSAKRITPLSVSEYNDKAVWILWGCDKTDLKPKK